MPTHSQDTLEEIRRDLQETQDKYARTQEKLAELEARRDRLQNAYEVLRDYLGEGPLADDDLSIADAARFILRDADGALSVAEIANEMLSRGFPYEKGREKLRRSLAGTLSRDNNDFERVERGVYELIYEEDEEEYGILGEPTNSENEEAPSAE